MIKEVNVTKRFFGKNALPAQESKHAPMKVSFRVDTRVDFTPLMHAPKLVRSSCNVQMVMKRQSRDDAIKSQLSR